MTKNNDFTFFDVKIYIESINELVRKYSMYNQFKP